MIPTMIANKKNNIWGHFSLSLGYRDIISMVILWKQIQTSIEEVLTYICDPYLLETPQTQGYKMLQELKRARSMSNHYKMSIAITTNTQ